MKKSKDRNLVWFLKKVEASYTKNHSKMSSPRGGANLPLARVKTIMKSSPEVETVTQESLFLITRATVSFYFLLFLSLTKPEKNSLCSQSVV